MDSSASLGNEQNEGYCNTRVHSWTQCPEHYLESSSRTPYFLVPNIWNLKESSLPKPDESGDAGSFSEVQPEFVKRIYEDVQTGKKENMTHYKHTISNGHCHHNVSTKEQMRKLEPSLELIRYYQRKLESFDNEFENVLDLLQHYKKASDQHREAELELERREEESERLRKELKETKFDLLKETEAKERFKAHNEILELREQNYKTKIDTLMKYVGCSQTDDDYRTRDYQYHRCHRLCEQQREAQNQHILDLRFKLNEQEKETRKRIEKVLEEFRVRDEEATVQNLKNLKIIANLKERLKMTSDALHDRSKDSIQLKRFVFACKCEASIHYKMNALPPVPFSPKKRHIKNDVGSRSLVNLYREKCRVLQEDIRKLELEKEALTKDKEKENLLEQIKLLKSHCQRVEYRRKIEIEGFRSDVKELRNRLNEVENQLYKVVCSSKCDLDLLEVVTETTRASGRITREIRDLKSKLHTLEFELKHC